MMKHGLYCDLAVFMASLSCILGCGGGDEQEDNNEVGCAAENVIRLKAPDFPKEVADGGMFFETKQKGSNGYVKVAPNLIRIPDMFRGDALAFSAAAEMDDEGLHQKGSAYFNDPSSVYRCVVEHVESGHVIVRAAGGLTHSRAYIATEDEYVEKQNLKRGFYVLTGRRTVPLVNGSSETMYAYQQLDGETNRLVLEALKYNQEANRAASEENDRRCEVACEVAERDAQERKKAADEQYVKQLEDYCNKSFARYVKDCNESKFCERVYISAKLQDKISCTVSPYWKWAGKKFKFAQLVSQVKQDGWKSYAVEKQIAFLNLSQKVIDDFTKQELYEGPARLRIAGINKTVRFEAFILVDGGHKLISYDPNAGVNQLEYGDKAYVVDSEKDKDLLDIALMEINIRKSEGFRFCKEFHSRYGKQDHK